MLCSLRPPLFSRVPASALAVHRRSIGIARSFATSWTTATPPRASPKLITTPIFYVNAAPHVGHLHSMLLADVFARYARLREPDVPVVFSTGTDEHGLKIQTAARNAGMTELAMCDANSGRFRALAEAANISYTDFIRTSEPRHYRAVERFWNDLVAGGHIYKGSHSGWYAVSDECFYTASQIQDAEDGTKVSIESGSKVEWVEEENYKFRLSAFKEPLTKWLQANPNAVVPAYQRDAVINSLDTLSDLSISRPASRLQWGVPVPNDPDHTIYVWVDALVNYLTVLGYPSSDQSVDWSSAAVAEGQGWPAELQIVGKDIVRFHAVYWPALLMANGLPPPKTLLVHAHWTQNRFKMSKSLGNVADPFEAIARAGVDSVRSYLMASGGRLAEDSDYSYPSLVLHHKLLSDQIGNLLSRLSGKKVTGKIISTPELAAGSPSSQITAIDEVDEEINTLLRTTRDSVGKHMDGLHPGAAITEVMLLVAAANRHYSALQPWVSLPPTYTNLLRAYLYTYHTLRVTAILLSPIMPTKAHELLDALSVPEEGRTWESATFSLREEGEGEVGVLAEKVVEGMRRRGKKVLFARIFEEEAEEGKKKKT